VSIRVVFLATDVTVGNRNDQVNKRIIRVLLKAVHVLDKSVSVCSGHDGKVGVYQTKRQVVHVLGTQANKKLLLVQ